MSVGKRFRSHITDGTLRMSPCHIVTCGSIRNRRAHFGCFRHQEIDSDIVGAITLMNICNNVTTRINGGNSSLYPLSQILMSNSGAYKCFLLTVFKCSQSIPKGTKGACFVFIFIVFALVTQHVCHAKWLWVGAIVKLCLGIERPTSCSIGEVLD